MATKAQQVEQVEAIEALRTMIAPGDTLYTVLRNVARSGMSRTIDVYRITDNDPEWLLRRVATACGFTFDSKREAIRMDGGGMDMGFALVYDLSAHLFPQGFVCTGEGGAARGSGCPSNDHSNRDTNYEPHHHGDGGYALRQRWM